MMLLQTASGKTVRVAIVPVIVAMCLFQAFAGDVRGGCGWEENRARRRLTSLCNMCQMFLFLICTVKSVKPVEKAFCLLFFPATK